MTEQEYEALERFSIMTIEGRIFDRVAIKEIESQYGRLTAVRLWQSTRKKTIELWQHSET